MLTDVSDYVKAIAMIETGSDENDNNLKFTNSASCQRSHGRFYRPQKGGASGDPCCVSAYHWNGIVF